MEMTAVHHLNNGNELNNSGFDQDQTSPLSDKVSHRLNLLFLPPSVT